MFCAPPGLVVSPVRSVETELYGDCGVVTSPGRLVHTIFAVLLIVCAELTVESSVTVNGMRVFCVVVNVLHVAVMTLPTWVKVSGARPLVLKNPPKVRPAGTVSVITTPNALALLDPVCVMSSV